MNNHSRLTTTDDRRLQNSPNYSNKVAVVTGSSTEAVLRAITSKDPDFRYVDGEDAKSIMNIRKIVRTRNLKTGSMKTSYRRYSTHMLESR